MPRSLTAQKLSESAKEGFQRLDRFRKARAYAVKEYCGTYMTEKYGITGEKPLNLVFMAIRALVPNLVQRAGMTRVLTDLLVQRDYAEKMGLALQQLHKKLKLHKTLRSGIVDMSLGGLAIFKSGLDATGEYVPVTDDIHVDPMQLYTKLVSLDDLTVDPICRSFDRAAFVGHRVYIERAKLLEADGFDKDLVKRLPRAGSNKSDDERAEMLTREDGPSSDFTAWQDFVNIVEIWVPDAEAIVCIPDPADAVAQDFLSVREYYGPPTGPYTFGAITQPVPDNPFPVAPVGVWRDLADMANRLFKKAMDQADRQKNIGIYNPANADVAEAVHDALDGEWVASEDPQGINIQSFEGADPGTVQMTQGLYGWFNLLSGGTDLMAGVGLNSDKATGQQILQQNASVSIGDMRDMLYEVASDISMKHAWYLHNDDLMFVPSQPGIPLIKRQPTGEEQQMYLTPADKTGEFDTLGFEIVERSMSVLDPSTRERLVSYFAQQVMPQAFASFQIATQAGLEFNVSRYLMNVAEDLGITSVVDDIWSDPQFRARMQWYSDQVGKPKKLAEGGGSAMPGVMQNGGAPVGGTPMGSPMEQFNQNAQQGAVPAQQALKTGGPM